MPYINTEVEVYVDLNEIDSKDLLEELRSRKESVSEFVSDDVIRDLAYEIYLAKFIRHQPYDQTVNELVGSILNKVL